MNKNKSVNILLISNDLRELLVRREEGVLKPIALDVCIDIQSSGQQDWKTRVALPRAFQDVTGVEIPFKAWAQVLRVAPDLYVATTDFSALAPAMAAHPEWGREDLKLLKQQALLGTDGTAPLARLLKAMDASDAACQVQLVSLLEHAARDLPSEPVHWPLALNDDTLNTRTYCCHDCCCKRVEGLKAINPAGDYHVGGGKRSGFVPVVPEGLPDCADCGKALDAKPGTPGIRSEIERVIKNGIDLEGEGAARTAHRLLALLGSEFHHFEPIQQLLHDMVRAGDKKVSPQQMKQIGLDNAVINAITSLSLEDLTKALDAGGSPSAMSHATGMPAAYFACQLGQGQMLELLCRRGADLDARVLARGAYPPGGSVDNLEFGRAVIHAAVHDNDWLKMVLEHRCDVDARDGQGWTVLDRLCQKVARPVNPEQAIKQMLFAGADPHAKNGLALSPLEHADRFNPDIAQLIRGVQAAMCAQQAIQKGADSSLKPL